MQRNIFLLVLFTPFLFCNILNAKPRSLWTPEKYDEYDFETFAELSVAQHPIDMENIDYFLLHAAIFYETNRVRAAAGLPQLEHSYNLEMAAKSHSADMVRRDFFNHISPVENKRTVVNRLDQVGLDYGFMGENIAYLAGIKRDPDKPVFTPEQNSGYFSHEFRGAPIPNHSYLSLAREVVRQWMLSEGHRRNILNPLYKYLGCGAQHYNDAQFFNMDRFKITQNFANRAGNLKSLVQPENDSFTHNNGSSGNY